MATDVTREEFEARTGVLEREVEGEGEKLVTRHILEQTRRNGDDLAAVKTRLDRIEEKLDGVDLKGLVRKVDGLDRKVDGLAENLPRIVGDVMREVLRERDGK
jgi:hypothetical protein